MVVVVAWDFWAVPWALEAVRLGGQVLEALTARTVVGSWMPRLSERSAIHKRAACECQQLVSRASTTELPTGLRSTAGAFGNAAARALVVRAADQREATTAGEAAIAWGGGLGGALVAWTSVGITTRAGSDLVAR